MLLAGLDILAVATTTIAAVGDLGGDVDWTGAAGVALGGAGLGGNLVLFLLRANESRQRRLEKAQAEVATAREQHLAQAIESIRATCARLEQKFDRAEERWSAEIASLREQDRRIEVALTKELAVIQVRVEEFTRPVRELANKREGGV